MCPECTRLEQSVETGFRGWLQGALKSNKPVGGKAMTDKKDRERVIAENHTFASHASGERTRLSCEPRTGSRISQPGGASFRDVEAHDAGR
jgi:hypothetical protein